MDTQSHSPSDAQLLARSHRDADAFRELYERFAQRIYAYHHRCSRDPDAAQDLTAETFAQAWLARRRFRDEADGSAAPWLFGIARNVLLMSVRQRSLERAGRARLGLLDGSASAREAHEPDESWLAPLEAALDDLPESQREAIRLRFDQDLAYEDVAMALETSPQAARVRVHRALNALRARLSETTEAGR
ncbi:MAG TPA: sigma-70 family RNA polymerase sigma factor [Solirubrobacteraceae bacterium]|jgi:RNA polymerase sigma-70 factor (ECF subfamily)